MNTCLSHIIGISFNPPRACFSGLVGIKRYMNAYWYASKSVLLPSHLHSVPMEADTRPHLPILPFYLGVQLGNAFLIALSPRRLGRVVGTTALLAAVASVYRFTTGDAQRNYSIGNTFMSQAFGIVLLVWLKDPIHDVRHECDLVPPTELPFARRVWWALCLINSPRGIGWSCEVRIVTLTSGPS